MASITLRKGKRSQSYQVKIRIEGHAITKSFKRKRDASDFAIQTESEIRLGKYFSGKTAKNKTVANMLDRYMANVLENHYGKHQHSHVKFMLTYWKEHIGAVSLSHVTPALISEYRDRLASEPSIRKQKLKPATVNHYLLALSHVFKIAAQDWGWIENNPVSVVNKMRVSNARTRFLTEKERDRLLRITKEHPNKYLYPFILIALTTGARKSEILYLQWQHVDFKKSLFRFVDTKNGESRSVVIVPQVAEILRDLRPTRYGGQDYVFRSKYRNIPTDFHKDWKKAFRDARLNNFRFHDLRHTVASYLAMNGATLIELSQILGHKTMQMVKRYAHLTENHTNEIVSKMTNEFL